MTGIAMAATAGGGIVGNPVAWSVSYAAAVGSQNSVQAQIQYVDGGLVGSAGQGTETVTTGSNWYSPAQAAGKLSYWIRATLSAGTAPDVGTRGTWIALSTSPIWGWNVYTTVISKTCTLKFDIASDAAGANIVYTSTSNVVAISHA